MPIKHKKSKWISYTLLGVVVLGILSFFTFQGLLPQAQAASRDLHGWAWSSHVGWVGFNCEDVSVCATTNYKVVYDDVSGNLTGYAWSSSIGWINFSPSLTGAPDSAGAARVVNAATGEVRGWIRACSVFASGCAGALKSSAYLGGWDGWIKLSGTNHASPNFTTDNNGDGVIDGGVTFDQANSRFLGNAWGGEVVGWLNFRNSAGGVTIDPPLPLPVADLRANGADGSTSIPSGSSAQLTWCGSPASPCTNASSCSVTSPSGPTWTGTSGTQSTGPLIASQTYTLTCTNVSGTVTDSVTVNIAGAGPAPDLITSHAPITINGSLNAGNALTFTGTVKNEGDDTAVAGSTGRWCIDGGEVECAAAATPTTELNTHGFGSFGVLEVSSPRTSNAWTAVAGPHTIWWCADVLNAVTDESDEGNNCSSSDFTVAPGGGGGGGTFSISCSDTDTVLEPPGGSDPCDIIVQFSPALDANSTPATLTITPQGGFAGNVTFSVLDVVRDSDGYIMPPARYEEVYTNVTPPSTATPPYPKDIVFKLNVSKLEADPDVDRISTVHMRAVAGAQTQNFDLRLRVKASSPGSGEQ